MFVSVSLVLMTYFDPLVINTPEVSVWYNPQITYMMVK